MKNWVALYSSRFYSLFYSNSNLPYFKSCKTVVGSKSGLRIGTSVWGVRAISLHRFRFWFKKNTSFYLIRYFLLWQFTKTIFSVAYTVLQVLYWLCLAKQDNNRLETKKLYHFKHVNTFSLIYWLWSFCSKCWIKVKIDC